MNTVVPDQRGRPVVTAVDGSRNCLAIVDLGVAEAVRHRAPLTIVHVWPGRYTGPFRSYEAAQGAAGGARLLDLAARRAAHVAPGLRVETELLEGSAAIAVVDRSAGARVLVIGHRDEILTRPSWGSTAAYLAHHCVCPLLVHRGAVPDRGPVVLAASARHTPTPTAGWAFDEALRRSARLVAIHVWGRPSGAVVASPTDAQERQRAQHRLNDALAGPAALHPGVPVEQVVLRDLDVPYTIERAARRGRLLVAGTGRHGRLAELLYGSLSTSIARQAPCPVLLVPPGTPTGDIEKSVVDGLASDHS
jgi:nucleotide-binding universal stress UspA family protein